MLNGIGALKVKKEQEVKGGHKTDAEDLSNEVRSVEEIKKIEADFKAQMKTFLKEIDSRYSSLSRKEKKNISATFKGLLKDLKQEGSQIEVLSHALEVSNRELPEDLKEANQEEKKNLHTKYVEKSEEENKIAEDKLDSLSKKSLIYLFKILNKNEYPVGVIGSNAYILLTETDKKSKDCDICAGVPDFVQNFSIFKNLEKNGEIENLLIKPVSDLDGKKNDCFEINFYLKIGNEKKEISIFYNNVKKEKGDVVDNGITSLGYKDNIVDVYKLKDENGEPVNINSCGKSPTEYLYTFNFLSELAIMAYENYKEGQEKYPWITPKALFRLNNLLNLNDDDFGKIIVNLNSFLQKQTDEKLKNKFKESVGFLVKLKKNFKNKESLKEGENGVFVSFAKEKKIDLSKKDKIIESFTKELVEDMNTTSQNFKKINRIFEQTKKELIKFPDPSEKMAKKESAKQEIGKLAIPIYELYDKYYDFLSKVDKNSKEDFVLFVGADMIKNNFLFSAICNIWAMEKELQ